MLLKRVYLGFGCLLLAASGLLAQMNRGTITGTVTDPAGAYIPGAKIVITNTATGIKSETMATDSGQYTVPNLTPGPYEVQMTAPSFKKLVRSNVDLGATQILRIDGRLEIGQVSESVSVTAEVPRIQTDSREVGTSLANQEIIDLPLSFAGVRSPENFAFKITPGVNGNTWTSHVNGSMSFSKEVMVDGASAATQLGGDFTTGPVSVEAVGEFKVLTSGLNAEFGRSQGGVFNFVMKSGTNDIHGSAFGMLRNEALNANTFANNARNVKRPLDRKQIFGGSFGGPVVIPKLYDGKNKTFFYTAYERYRERSIGFGSPNRTVPIPDFYEGNFSRLLGGPTGQKDALGRDVLRGAIYDPATFAQTSSGRWIGEMFPGNIIPKSRFSSVSQNVNGIMKQYYLPAIQNADGTYPLQNNALFPIANAPVFDNHQYSVKMDQNINDKHRLSGSLSWGVKDRSTLADAGGIWSATEVSDGGPLSAARSQRLVTPYGRLAHDWVVTPSSVNHWTWSFNRLKAPTLSRHADIDGASQLGIENLSTYGFPSINWGSGPFIGLTNIGDPAYTVNNYIQWGFLDTFSFNRGKHFFKAGVDFRTNQLNSQSTQGGGFAFAARATAIPNEPFSGNLTGYSFASFLLGIVDSASLNDPIKLGGRRKYLGLFFQDDYKATNRLTLQIGLRWEFQPPMYEVYDRLSSWSPFAKDPASGLPGAYEFAGDCQGCTGKRYFGRKSYRDFGPRIGFAYRLTEKTTFRGGYGVFFSPDVFNNFGSTPLGKPTNVQAGGTFALAADNVNPWRGIFNWDAGMPTDCYRPAFNDVSWGNRNGPGMFDLNYGRTGYIQEWNLNVQQEIGRKVVVDLGYIANKSTGLQNGNLSRINQLPASVLSQYGATLNRPVRNEAEAAAYGIRYPFPGFAGTVASALREFPQIVGNATINNFGAPLGFASYHSFQATVNRQFGGDLNVYANWTWSKVIGNTRSLMIGDNPGPLDYYNLRLEKAILDYDQPHLVKAFIDYRLPFGRGKKFLGSANRAVDLLVGGWTVSGIVNYFSGSPLGYGGSFPLSGGWNGSTNRANIQAGEMLASGFKKSEFQLLSPSAAVNTYLNKSLYSDPAPLTLGTSAPRYGQTRSFATLNEDIGIQKNFLFGEKYRLQFRGELLNAFNRSILGGIQTGVTNPLFGQVTGIGGNRQVQLGLRFDF